MEEVVMFDDWIQRCKRLGFHAVKLDKPEVITPTDGFGGRTRIELWYYIADMNGDEWSDRWQTESLAWEHAWIYKHDAELLEVGGELAKLIYSSGDRKETKRLADKLIIRALLAMATDETRTLIEAIVERYEKLATEPATAATGGGLRGTREG